MKLKRAFIYKILRGYFLLQEITNHERNLTSLECIVIISFQTLKKSVCYFTPKLQGQKTIQNTISISCSCSASVIKY